MLTRNRVSSQGARTLLSLYILFDFLIYLWDNTLDAKGNMRKTKSDAGKEPNPGSQQRCYREDRPMQKPIERVALVTGANRGIGFEIARQLALKKITVLMGARHKERGLVAQNKLADQGLDVHFIPIDVTDPTTMEAAIVHLPSMNLQS
jgi:hypothetical protein